jgi:hypothetical protein
LAGYPTHDGISFNQQEIAMDAMHLVHHREPWNKGKLVG